LSVSTSSAKKPDQEAREVLDVLTGESLREPARAASRA
jgi:hypothetical protein